MKVAIVSCNIGAIDEIRPPCKQSVPFDLYYYTESTLPFPLPNLDARMKGKYLKTQMNKFVEPYDFLIWIDGSIEIIAEDFVDCCIKCLGKYGQILIEPHSQRSNVYDELEYIINKMKAGDRYLLKRYARQPLYQEYEFYRSKGLPKDYPLYQCSFFAIRNDREGDELLNDWWDAIIRYSNFDQTQLSYALWRNSTRVEKIDTKDLFIRHKHLGYNL